MKFQVPQFIEVEDKIFGPLTFKQFIYLAGGAGLAYLFFRFLPLYIAVFPILISVGLGLALAFYKINNRPFIKMMESAFNYVLANKLYIWKKEDKKIEPREAKLPEVNIFIPKLSDSKLKDLTWSLDINESINAKRARSQHSI